MTYIILESGKWEKVPPGADPDRYRAWAEMRDELKARPVRRYRRTYRAGSRNRKRTNYASQVVAHGLAMAELVDRVNESETQQ